MKKATIIFSLVLSLWAFAKSEASTLAVGGAVGGDFPFAHGRHYDPGVSAEGFYRIDPYEIRFHYSHTKTDTYSILLAMKYFFTNTLVRPYAEAAIGPTIIDPDQKGLAYGVRPEVSLGADLGISQHFSTGIVVRYYAMMVFGDAGSGDWQANHGMSILGNVILWF